MTDFMNLKETIEFFNYACHKDAALADDASVPVLVIGGARGSGKTMFANMLASNDETALCNPGDLRDRFGALRPLEGKKLLVIDNFAQDIWPVLKDIIHAKRLRIELKGQEAYTIRNSLVGLVIMLPVDVPVVVTARRLTITDIETAYRAFAATFARR